MSEEEQELILTFQLVDNPNVLFPTCTLTDLNGDSTNFNLYECQTDCYGKSCGNNGCGGSCGSCEAGQECSEDFTCAENLPENSEESCLPTGDVYDDDQLTLADITVLQIVLGMQNNDGCGDIGENYCFASNAYVCKNGIVKPSIEEGETCENTACTPIGDVYNDDQLTLADITVLQIILGIQNNEGCGSEGEDYCFVSNAYVCKNGIVKQTIEEGEKC